MSEIRTVQLDLGLKHYQFRYSSYRFRLAGRPCGIALEIRKFNILNMVGDFPVRVSPVRRFGAALAPSHPQALEENMKFSREFHNEQQAETRELVLRAAGYQAWRKHAPDGNWQVFWLVPTTSTFV